MDDLPPARTERTAEERAIEVANLCGEGLNIGRDGGAPVTRDYPGDRLWTFTGGKILQVAIDVSGEPYIDFEKEAIAMMKRD